jgi:hypothetical protein
MRTVRPEPSPAGLRQAVTAGIPEVSRFSRMKLLGVPGVFDYPDCTETRAIAPAHVAFRTFVLRRRPGCMFCRVEVWRHVP